MQTSTTLVVTASVLGEWKLFVHVDLFPVGCSYNKVTLGAVHRQNVVFVWVLEHPQLIIITYGEQTWLT